MSNNEPYTYVADYKDHMFAGYEPVRKPKNTGCWFSLKKAISDAIASHHKYFGIIPAVIYISVVDDADSAQMLMPGTAYEGMKTVFLDESLLAATIRISEDGESITVTDKFKEKLK